MQGSPEGVLSFHAPDHPHLPCLDEVGAPCISALLHHHCVVRQPLQLHHSCQVMQLPCCPAPVHISASCLGISFLPHHACLASCTSTHNCAPQQFLLQQVHVTGHCNMATSHGVCTCYCVTAAKQHAQQPLATAVKVVTTTTVATFATFIAASSLFSRTNNCTECCCDQHNTYRHDCCKA